MDNDYYAHQSAYIDEGCEIGSGSKIWLFTHIMSGAQIGKNCQLGQNVFVDHSVVIGDNVKIQNNVSLYKSVTIQDGVFLGPSCVFTNVVNPRAFIERKNEFRPTLVKRGASIGANATIICGNTIGEYALVGAGSLVTKDIADYALVYGTPACVQGYVCQCGEQIFFVQNNAQCSHCGKQYIKSASRVVSVSK